jgi:hypothetical protein
VALALWTVVPSATVVSQEPSTSSSIAHCALPSAGILRGSACDTITSLLPVPIELRSAPDIRLTREDVEAIALGALARRFDTAARADSGWAFSHRDTSHLWVGVDAASDTALRATVLYWSLRPDRTLSLLCDYRGTLAVPRPSVPALAALLAAEIEDVARCARTEEARLDPSRPVPPPPPTPFHRTTLAALLTVLFVLIVGGALLWRYLRPRMPDFWQVAARYPDKAYDWFVSHDEWVVIDPASDHQPKVDQRAYEGPFLLWVPKLGGRRIVVYGRRGAMKESQRAFLMHRGVDSNGLPRV